MTRKRKRPIKRIVREIPGPIRVVNHSFPSNLEYLAHLIKEIASEAGTNMVVEELFSNMSEIQFRIFSESIVRKNSKLDRKEKVVTLGPEDTALRQRIQDKMRGSNGS